MNWMIYNLPQREEVDGKRSRFADRFEIRSYAEGISFRDPGQ